jgi:RNase H-like domain found in reverse transcriptase/Integrase zinc binding domain
MTEDRQVAWKPLVMNQVMKFPVERRPQRRELSTAPQEEVEEWFKKSEITVGDIADTPRKQDDARRLFYTWRDCFVERIRDVKPTDLIQHSIDLLPNARPKKEKMQRYTQREREFAAKIFPEMEEAGVIVRGSSNWGARTKFPPKKDADKLRVVHNFIPVNSYTIKPQYPMHLVDEVLETIIRPYYTTWFIADASNGYWAVRIRPGDEHKAAFITPHGLYLYLRMGQGLKGAPHTYSQFTDLVFGPLPKTRATERMPSIIGTHADCGFSPFMDDHIGGFTTYEAQFRFLHEVYFPRVAFGPICLSGRKTRAFCTSLEVLGFSGSAEGLRPSARHQDRMRNWPTPRTREELEAFIWLTPFLRIFIPGRADHVRRLKEAYLELVPVPLPPKEGDEKGRNSTRMQWIEKAWSWTSGQQESFDYIKKCISENAMSGADPKQQYHLATDASKYGTGGVLFQLHGEPAGTEAQPRYRSKERIIMFMSFRLSDPETRYGTTDREALAVVRALAEVRWLVIGSPYPVKLYTDHQALDSILRKGTEASMRITRWQDRLNEYDFEVHHRPGKSHTIGIADGLSRMPTRYTTIPKAEDSERMALPALRGPRQDQYAKFRQTKEYADVVDFLTDGVVSLREKGLGASQIKNIRRKALSYQLTETGLLWKERNGSMAKCILKEEVPATLKHFHDGCGHFASAITLDRTIGQVYWPQRTRDIEDWCGTCKACQRLGPRRKSTTLKPIIKFEPLAMMGLDFLGPISPRCKRTGAKYMLIAVDYFTRYTWIRPFRSADGKAVISFFDNFVAPNFGFPFSLYTDNGSHFVGDPAAEYFQAKGIQHYDAPVSHPSSVGLVERGVQLVISRLRAYCIDNGQAGVDTWGAAAGNIMQSINTRLVRIHGFTPAELMFGYRPTMDRTIRGDEEAEVEDPEDYAPHLCRLYIERRDGSREQARNTMAAAHKRMETQRNPVWTKPKEGDLVLLWNAQLEKHLGKKLESRWSEPHRLVRINPGGVSGQVCKLYGDGSERRIHLDDMKVYCPRSDYPSLIASHVTVTHARETMKYAGFPGQRALNLASD